MPSPTKRFSAHFRERAADVWDAMHCHPFVVGIGDGTLPPDPFRLWIRQDYLFLVEYARVLALGAARAPDLETMSRFADLSEATLGEGMELHRSYAGEIGISAAELETEQMLPTTQAYTDFLVRSAAHGDFAELVAALLPCIWGYSEVGERLAAKGMPSHDAYAEWIEMYSSERFAELASWCRALTDRIAGSAASMTRERMRRAFVTSSRYELAFWDMAWSG
jgi:thiaminase/transcriptional activator TenA